MSFLILQEKKEYMFVAVPQRERLNFDGRISYLLLIVKDTRSYCLLHYITSTYVFISSLSILCTEFGHKIKNISYRSAVPYDVLNINSSIMMVTLSVASLEN